MQEQLRRAWQARSALHTDSQTNAYRLFHGYSEGHPGLEIDRYGEVAIIGSRGDDETVRQAAAHALRELHTFSCIVDAPRGGEVRVLHGTMPGEPTTVLELGLRYSVEVWAARNPGLYLDARPARAWLRDNSERRRVLNLFAYAGSLGVAAMAGGALSVTHVDTQKRALSRCAVNHRLNGQRTDDRDLIRMDVAKYVQRLSRPEGNRKFGGVIIDAPPLPPSAAPDAIGLSPVGLAAPVCAALDTGAWVLVFFHHDARSWDDLEDAFRVASGCQLAAVWRSRSGIDFPQAREEQDLRLSAFRRAGP